MHVRCFASRARRLPKPQTRSAGNIPELRFACWDLIPNPEAQNCPALQTGSFSVARPCGRLSFAAVAAVGGELFVGEEALDVLKVAQIARRPASRKNLARLCAGNYQPAQRVDLGDARVKRRNTLPGGGEFFARSVGAGVEFFAVICPVLLQEQQHFRHLHDAENLCPAHVTDAFSRREFGLMSIKAHTPAFAACRPEAAWRAIRFACRSPASSRAGLRSDSCRGRFMGEKAANFSAHPCPRRRKHTAGARARPPGVYQHLAGEAVFPVVGDSAGNRRPRGIVVSDMD